MVADAVKHVVHTMIMLWVLRRQLGSLGGSPVARSAAKSLLAAALTGLGAFAAAHWLPGTAGRTLTQLLPVVVGGVTGVLIYTICVFALNIEETRALPRLLRRR